MDPLRARPGTFRVRPLRLATLAAAFVAVAACAEARNDGRASYESAPPPARAAREPSAGPAPRAPSRSPYEFARLETAIHRFAGDRAGRLPVSLQELTSARSPEGDHYLTTVPTDVWGRPYSYGVESIRFGTYDLRSNGPDSLPGTDDDIVADSKPVPVR